MDSVDEQCGLMAAFEKLAMVGDAGVCQCSAPRGLLAVIACHVAACAWHTHVAAGLHAGPAEP